MTDAPAPGFESFELVLLVRPPDAPALDPDAAEALQEAHLAHLRAMRASGDLLFAGPFDEQDDESLRGLCVYRTGDVERVRALASKDPAVRAGRLGVQVLRLWCETGRILHGDD